ncbi:hypothetical protein HBH53_031740 [Parastagonospora nodorum]|nr:hypothetical protein HBH53_031740 [Parastagonospora nodorum]KAH4097113.1 hypothetical protein HBH48_042190 [Parastagonospora nodorum]KAH4100578.1 hypothetical protein HBH46_150930 [Parastagonospora nodorum]KAH4120856.1 hypothetical protein HBH47_105970 [Parastagonospora nodorum]KAH4406432.1 hypothetical protein HBH92_167940 [Parastagonospora nodorum]
MKEHEQNLPLLEDEGLNSPDSRQSRYSPFLSRVRQTKFVVALGIYGLLMTAIVVVQNLPHAKKADPYSPAGHLLQFEQQKANPDEHSIFSDPPSSEVDKAWDDLVRPIYFSATEEEVKSSNEEPDDTVSLLDRDGYLGTIGVYHGLHCMRRIYWHLHEDTYFKNRTAEARAVEIVHARHCLGVVVNDLMCNADTALYTFGYYPDRDPIPRLKSGASRQCLKWDPFHQWATDRAPGYHPRLQAPVNLLRERTFEGSLQAEDMDVSSLKE